MKKLIITLIFITSITSINAQKKSRNSDFSRLQLNLEIGAAHMLNKQNINNVTIVREDRFGNMENIIINEQSTIQQFGKFGLMLNYRSGYQNLIALGVMYKPGFGNFQLNGISIPVRFTQILTSRFNSDGTRSSKIEGLALSAGVEYNFRNTLSGGGKYSLKNETLNTNMQGNFRVSFFVDMGIEFYIDYNFDISKINDKNGNEFSYDNIGFGLQFPIWSIVK